MTDVAVVGCGVAGREHLAAYRSMAGVRVVAVCDVDEERAHAAAPQGGSPAARVYTDARRLLEEAQCDLVSVCVPPVVHRDVTVDAFLSGAHVIARSRLR